MNRLWIPTLAVSLTLSANAFADHDRYDDDRDYRPRHRAERVVVERQYVGDGVVYRERVLHPARPGEGVIVERQYVGNGVVRRERIVQREYPVERVVVERRYAEPAVVYRKRGFHEDDYAYDEPEVAPRYAPPLRREPAPREVYAERGGNQATGQIIGAIAGGVIGSRFGGGNGRIATTAAGAVVGSVIGGNLAR